jgi:hypothetical protein
MSETVERNTKTEIFLNVGPTTTSNAFKLHINTYTANKERIVKIKREKRQEKNSN